MTREELILSLFDLLGLSVCESGNNVSLITVSITRFFLNITNHFSEDLVKYVGVSPITDGI